MWKIMKYTTNYTIIIKVHFRSHKSLQVVQFSNIGNNAMNSSTPYGYSLTSDEAVYSALRDPILCTYLGSNTVSET